MIEINNKHIVLIFIIIIIGVFVYNFDVYVISKNEPLCKPIYITKREIGTKIRAELNKPETKVLKETFSSLVIPYGENKNIETFGDSDGQKDKFDVPPKSFSSFTITSLTDPIKLKVVESVIKILSYVPTNYCEEQIKQMVEYFAIIYQNSDNLEIFYKNVASSTKIKIPPYNSKYSHLILYLFGKFDNVYNNSSTCDNSNNSTNLELELGGMLFSNNLTQEQIINIIPESTENNPNNSNITNNEIILPSNNNNIMPQQNYLSESNTDTEYVQTIPMGNQTINQGSYLIPTSTDTVTATATSTAAVTATEYYPNPISYNSSNLSKSQCNYKCDNSYSNKIGYLESELKPLETFGMSSSYGYAPF